MAETIADIGEFALIGYLQQVIEREGDAAPGAVLGIGDDAAVLQVREGCELLVTGDALVEGQHYVPEYTTPRDLGSRAMSVNLSDIGAMGGQPLFALVSLGLRGETPVVEVENMYRGMVQALNPHSAAIVGGNTTLVDGKQFIDVTLMGEVEAGKAVRRSSASVGDAILTTGFPGQAAAGLRLLKENGYSPQLAEHPLVRAYTRPPARAREGRQLGLSGWLTAMIDTSDGFLGDLGHLCEGSGVGAVLYTEMLPMSPELVLAAESWEAEPIDLFFSLSDDYELIFTCRPEHVQEVKDCIARISEVMVSQVGEITARKGEIALISSKGESRLLQVLGWDHFATVENPGGDNIKEVFPPSCTSCLQECLQEQAVADAPGRYDQAGAFALGQGVAQDEGAGADDVGALLVDLGNGLNLVVG